MGDFMGTPEGAAASAAGAGVAAGAEEAAATGAEAAAGAGAGETAATGAGAENCGHGVLARTWGPGADGGGARASFFLMTIS